MNVAVLGADFRGQTITRHCVRGGHDVCLYDDDADRVMDSIDALANELSGLSVTDYVTATTGLRAAVDRADLVIDATGDETDTRRERLAEIETMIDEETLVVTGDRTVSVTAVATALHAPGRAIGLNIPDFAAESFVEVVLADQTTATTMERATTFVEGLSVVPIVVRDRPGFATARLELARMAEAIRMAQSDIASVPDIDRVATDDDSNRRGPLARADEVGLDTVCTGLMDLTDRLGDRFRPPELLETAVSAGKLGKKTGEGFYVWTDGEPTRPSELCSITPSLNDDSDHC